MVSKSTCESRDLQLSAYMVSVGNQAFVGMRFGLAKLRNIPT